MKRDGNWAAVERLYLDVAGLAPEEQAAVLEDACAGDEALRAEVESLLEADRRRGTFLERPPARLAADLLDRHPSALAPGARVGGYRVERLLSVGGMGEVYLTRAATTGHFAVVKLIRRHLAVDPVAVNRFAVEARAAGSLRHPNIVAVFESGESAAGLFIAMEWVDGMTLRAVMDGGRVEIGKAVAWSRQMARGLAAAHAAGIVHRDMKPENIMVDAAGVVKILDFGLARVQGVVLTDAPGSGGSGTLSGTLSGTFSYLAPELLRGEPASSDSDVFALGSVLYELFTGRHPFAGETPLDVYEAIECRTPEAPSTLRAGMPHGVDAVLLGMLNREIRERPAAGAIARVFEAMDG